MPMNIPCDSTVSFKDGGHGRVIGYFESPGAPGEYLVAAVAATSRVHLRLFKYSEGVHMTIERFYSERHEPIPTMKCFGLFFESELMPYENVPAQRAENRFPHSCPGCGLPAYIGFVSVECSVNCKGR